MQLSKMFTYHGTDSKKYQQSVPFYEKFIQYFTCLDELIYKVESLDDKEKEEVEDKLIKPFKEQAKYIKDVFLQNPADFKHSDIEHNLPYLVVLKELERVTKTCKNASNCIFGPTSVKKHPDSEEHMVMLLNKLALKHEEAFRRET